MTPPAQRVTRGFSIDEDGPDSKPAPRRIRTRQQIMNGEGKRPPAAVPLSVLAHNPLNPRDELTEIEETAASLKEKGQLQPVAVVRRAAFLTAHPGREEQIGTAEYVVVDGNRRLAAASVAGLAELRIDVNDDLATSAEDMLESALIANVHRVDVPPLDQAKAIQELLSKHGSQEKVAKRLGKSGAWVSQRLALLGLTEDLQEKVESGELTVKEGRRIGRLPASRQETEAAAALNRVKAPRKPRSKGTSAPNTERPATSSPSQTAVEDAVEGTDVGSLNPVKEQANGNALHLPWNDPKWFNDQLRLYMSAEHREELVLLLMADS
ncbi:ParB/RepB/Spo0J family partition protein [Streptomyces youssoufiensis]